MFWNRCSDLRGGRRWQHFGDNSVPRSVTAKMIVRKWNLVSHECWLIVRAVAFSELTSHRFSTCAFLSIRFMKPASTVPGPSSMNCVKPSASK